ncbi:hypothetical protein FOZ63_016862 [Perkinsus olseni]|uniref:Uncharacterized protein n=1 Tax=Perkinsus olseni TaxID=32597 RepID=A0A7J6U7T0_PEROL|nr:hypothetical protein FOZ63_016862 [Perkinsus olseni]
MRNRRGSPVSVSGDIAGFLYALADYEASMRPIRLAALTGRLPAPGTMSYPPPPDPAQPFEQEFPPDPYVVELPPATSNGCCADACGVPTEKRRRTMYDTNYFREKQESPEDGWRGRGGPEPQKQEEELDSDWEWCEPRVTRRAGYRRNRKRNEVDRRCPVRGCHAMVDPSELERHILAQHQGSSHAAEIRRRFEDERAFREREENPAGERPKIAGVKCPTPLVGLLLAKGTTSSVPANYRPHPEIGRALAEGELQQHPREGWTLARICASLIYSCRIERIGKMRERCLEELLSRTYQPIMEKLPRAYRNGDLEPIRQAMCEAYRRRTLPMDERATVLLLWRYSRELPQ